jgi:predicted GNAT family acetyltransferase
MHSVVRDNPDEERYEIVVDGRLAGFAQYRVRPGLLAFVHTEVDDAYEGQGLGSKLVDFALADVRGRDLDVLPFCPFVNAYIRRHPEYTELVPADRREAFGL